MLHEGLTTGQAAKYISRHPKTFEAMDRAGVLPARRTASGRRYGLRPVPRPLLGKNRGGATATHGVLWPRVLPNAAPGLEEPAAVRGRICHRPRYGQPGVYRGNWQWPKLQAPQVYGSGGFGCGGRSCDASRGSPGPVGALRLRGCNLCAASMSVSCWCSTGRRSPPSKKGCRIGWRSRMVFPPAWMA
jgi:hypothetical protein